MSPLAGLNQTTESPVIKQSAQQDSADNKVGNIDMLHRQTWWITQCLRGEVTKHLLLTHIGNDIAVSFQVVAPLLASLKFL